MIAEDSFGNTATSYTGTVHFSSTDLHATLPADSQLSGGTGVFSATFQTAGVQTLTASDATNSGINGSAVIAVGLNAVTQFSITTQASTVSGVSFTATVNAEDSNNNTTIGYGGTIHFTVSDGLASVPADATLTNGTGVFNFTLEVAGQQTITVSDTVNSGISGSTTISVLAGPATHFSIAAPVATSPGNAIRFTVTAQDTVNNTASSYSGTLDFATSDAAGVVPSASTLTGGVGVFTATLQTIGGQTVTATDTANGAINATANVYVSPQIGIPNDLIAGAAPSSMCRSTPAASSMSRMATRA